MEQGQVAMEKIGETGGGAQEKMLQLQASLSNLKTSIGTAFIPVLNAMIAPLADLVQKYSPQIQAFAQNFAGWLEGTLIPAITNFVSVAVNMIPFVIDLFKAFTGQVADWGNVFDTLASIFGEQFAEPIYRAILWISDKVYWLRTIFGDLVKAFTGQTADWQNLWKGLSKIFGEDFGNAIYRTILWINNQIYWFINKTLPDLINAFKTVVGWIAGTGMPAASSAVSTAFSTIGSIISSVVEFVKPILASIYAELSKFWTEIKPQVIKAWEAISARLQELWENVIKPVVAAITAWIKEHWDEISRYAKNAWDIISGIVELAWAYLSGIIKIGLALIAGDWEAAGEAMKEMTDKIWAAIQKIFGAAWDNIKITFGLFLEGLIDAIGGWAQRQYDAMTKPFVDAYNWLVSLPAQAEQAAADIMLGFIRGAARFAQSVIDAIIGPIKDAIRAAENLLGISSPSRLFEEMGAQMAAGLEVGFERGAGRFAPQLAMATTPAGVGGGFAPGGGGTVNNFNITVYANDYAGGRAATRGALDELRSRGLQIG
jgi:hypothetical protein